MDTSSTEKHLIIPREAVRWEEGLYENTKMAYLWEEPDTGRRAFFLKCEPGGSIPFHHHPRREIALLVEGEVRLNDDIMRAGDFLTASGEESHDVYSEKGCIFFLFIDYSTDEHVLVPKSQ